MAWTRSAVPGQTLCAPGVLTIRADLCHDVGEEFDAEIWMTGLQGSGNRIFGGQFFLEYSDHNLDVVSVSAADPPSIFANLVGTQDACTGDLPECTREIIKAMLPCCTKHERIVLAVLADFVPNQPLGTDRDSMMVKIRFRVVSEESEPFLRFRRDSDFLTNQVGTSNGDAVPTGLVDAGPASNDLRDFADFQNCFLAEGDHFVIECRCSFDFDADNDIDEADFDVLQPQFMNPVPLNCGAP